MYKIMCYVSCFDDIYKEEFDGVLYPDIESAEAVIDMNREEYERNFDISSWAIEEV